MEASILKAAIGSIEEELRIVKAQISEAGGEMGKKFLSLKGIWKGKTSFSLEDIKSTEIKLKEDL